jgi:hypothetical protein
MKTKKETAYAPNAFIALDGTLSPPKAMLMCSCNRAQGQREFRHALFIGARSIVIRLGTSAGHWN